MSQNINRTWILNKAYIRFKRSNWNDDVEVKSFIKSAECVAFLRELNSEPMIKLAGQALVSPNQFKNEFKEEIKRYFE